MASLFNNDLTYLPHSFATSADAGQRMAQLQDTFRSAGLTKGPNRGNLPGKADSPLAGLGLGKGLAGAFEQQGRTRRQDRPQAPQMPTPPSGQINPPAVDDRELAQKEGDFAKAFGPKKAAEPDWDAQIARIEAEYQRERAARDNSAQPGVAMTPLQGPDTGAANPNAVGARPAPSAKAFTQQLTPHALRVAQQTGLDPRLVMGVTALETGWGQGAPRNNYFGVKGGNGPALATKEAGPDGRLYSTTGQFRGYADPGQSFDDFGHLMLTDPHYSGVIAAAPKGLDAQIKAFANSGYATDPDYEAKLRARIGQLPPVQMPEPPPSDGPPAVKRGGYFNMIRSRA